MTRLSDAHPGPSPISSSALPPGVSLIDRLLMSPKQIREKVRKAAA